MWQDYLTPNFYIFALGQERLGLLADTLHESISAAVRDMTWGMQGFFREKSGVTIRDGFGHGSEPGLLCATGLNRSACEPYFYSRRVSFVCMSHVAWSAALQRPRGSVDKKTCA